MNKDYYPTPKSLVHRMIEKFRLSEISSVLEPSAGKGDIVNAIRNRLTLYPRHNVQIDVIEIEPELQNTLRGNGFNLIHDDFLTFQTYRSYDLIIANFPFSNGDDHLIHAISLLLQNGGQLIGLVNAETLRNPYTQRRQMLVRKLQELNAHIKYLAGEFKFAERPSDVEVALIDMKVERKTSPSILIDHLKQAEQFSKPNDEPDKIVEKDFVNAMVSTFDFEVAIGAKLISEYHLLKPFMRRRLPKKGKDPALFETPTIKLSIDDSRHIPSTAQAETNAYLERVREKYWRTLVYDPRYTGQYTSNIIADLNQKMNELKMKDFSRFNIEQLAQDLRYQLAKGVETAILDLFDTFTRGHSYGREFDEGNVHLFNGWKTNKVWKVNNRVIIPLHGWSSWSNSLDYRAFERLADMAKVFDYLSTDKCCERLLSGIGQRRGEIHSGTTLDLRYFEIKLYKKGTCHIKFKDLDLLDKFNIFAAQRKGWLPPRYSKVAYDDLTTEERDTVDSFQTKDRYNEIYENADRFIIADATALLGTGEIT